MVKWSLITSCAPARAQRRMRSKSCKWRVYLYPSPQQVDMILIVHKCDLVLTIPYPIRLYHITFHEASIGLFSKRLEI